jgi:hypothetical protein
MRIYQNFYVYIHYDNNGIPFYVGKGKKTRYKSTTGRTDKWKSVADNGWTYKIVKDDLTEDEAFDLEYDIIQDLGFDNLTNSINAKGIGKTLGDEYYIRRMKEEVEKGVKQSFNNLFEMRRCRDYKSYNLWKPFYEKGIYTYHKEWVEWWEQNIKLNNLPICLNQEYPL